jgi:hypothetical protein
MQQSSPLLANGAPVIPDAKLRRLARFIAQELEALYGLQPPLLTAADVAKQYGLSRGWVYKHAHELGGQRMGNRPKARLRFRARDVQARLGELPVSEDGRLGPDLAVRASPLSCCRSDQDALAGSAPWSKEFAKTALRARTDAPPVPTHRRRPDAQTSDWRGR